MKKEFSLICLLFILISLFFFAPVLKGFIPFPGDLLVGEYGPYNSYPFLGYVPGSFPNKAQDFDVLRLIYPAKEFSIKMLKGFEWPLWNPYIFSGNPHLASFQSGSFYPVNIIFWLFPFNFAWGLYIILQPVLTGIFTYLFLREFNLKRKSAVFGGLVFAFSSYQTVWMEYGNIGHTILWLPLAMWLSLKNIKKPSLLTSTFLILSLTASILAGYIQTSFYVFVFLFAFIVFELFTKYRNQFFKKLIIFLPIFVLPVLLSAVQLLPSIELLFNSARSAYSLPSFIKLLIPDIHLVTLFVPDFFGNPATRNYWLNGTYIERVSYVGIIPLLFALYAVLKKSSKLVWFFASCAVIISLITFDSIFSRVLYSLFLPPIISTSVPTRVMFIFCFSLSVLGAFGFEYFQKEKINKKFWISMIFIGTVFVFLWFFVFTAPFIFKDQVWLQNLSISKRNLVIPSMIFSMGIFVSYLIFRFKNFKIYGLLLFFLITVFDLFFFFQKITPFAPNESVYPKTEVLESLRKIQGIDRSWGYGSAYIDANIQTHERIFGTNGYDALHIKRYGELLTASKDGKISGFVPGANTDIAPGFGEDDLRTNFFRQTMLNLLGVKYILHKIAPGTKYLLADNKTFPENIYKLIWQGGVWQIYENKEALPRFYLTGNYVVEQDKQEIANSIFNKNLDLRKTLILEEKVNNFNFKEDKNAKTSLVNYSPNKIVVKTESSEDNLLFLSDSFYPGWKAYIDGKEAKIYRADYAFRAVPVEKGSHEVVFNYYPKLFDLGIKISLITFFSIIIYTISFVILRRSRRISRTFL